MTIGYHRPTKAVINSQAIYNNIKSEQDLITDGAVIFAVVKANGYGHGAVEVAKIAEEAGVTGFCVALLDEALELRAAGFTQPILILGVVSPQYVSLLVENKLTATAPSLAWLKMASEELTKAELSEALAIHVKIDSGMGRLGLVTPVEISETVAYLKVHPEFYLEGLFTHFSKADSKDNAYFELQQSRFKTAIELFPKDVKYIHTANSATALWHNHWQSNLIRLGIAMYGLNPSGREVPAPYQLEQALSLVTELVHVKHVKKGERISYGAEYEALSDEWIGTLPIGYADGFDRRFKGYHLIIDGQPAQLVGRICMDQCMIRLPKEYVSGTKVTIFGENGSLTNSIQTAAEYIGTINYEIPCMLTERIPLEYLG